MSTVTGSFTGAAGPVPVPNVEVPDFDAGANHLTSPSQFAMNGRYENRQEVDMRLTVVAENFTGSATGASVDLGNGENTIVLAPGGKVNSPVVTVEGNIPAQAEPEQPGVSEPWSFDLVATWEVA